MDLGDGGGWSGQGKVDQRHRRPESWIGGFDLKDGQIDAMTNQIPDKILQ
jgi:hypothetical protein